MTFENFQQFFDEQDAIFCSPKNRNKSEQEEIFARTIKIGEEYGELCDQVLASNGNQRKDKLQENTPDDLGDEFADVIITTFLLAKSMGVDIPNALDHKTEKIRQKHNKQLS